MSLLHDTYLESDQCSSKPRGRRGLRVPSMSWRTHARAHQVTAARLAHLIMKIVVGEGTPAGLHGTKMLSTSHEGG